MPVCTEMGRLFVEARQHLGITAYETAKRSGLVPSTLSRVERGLSATIDMETFLLLCSTLELEPRDCVPTLKQIRELVDQERARQPE